MAQQRKASSRANTRITGPPKQDAMPKKVADYDESDVAYLAGIWDTNQNLRSLNDINAVAISRTDLWPNMMATTYGGESKEFTAKNGKKWYGWFVPIKLRLAILDFLRDAKAIKSIGMDEP